MARQRTAVAASAALLLAAAAAAAALRASTGGSLHAPTSAAPSGTHPEGVRLSFGDSPDEMVVTWSTHAPTTESCVQFRVLPGSEPVEPGNSSSRSGSAARRSSDGGSREPQAVGPLLPGVERHSSSSSGSSISSSSSSSSSSDGSPTVLLSLLSAPAPPQPALQTACGSSTPFVEPATGAVSLLVHRVVLAGLPPGRALRYRCGSAADGWSRWLASRSRRAPSQFSTDAPVSRV